MFKLLIELRLNPPLFNLKALDIDLLRVKQFILLIFEFLKFELKALLFAFLNSSANTFVTSHKPALFAFKFLLKVALIVADALLSLHLDVTNLLLLLELELVFERL